MKSKICFICKIKKPIAQFPKSNHINPCCSFDLSKKLEQRKCFNYKNLQPLWEADNLRKLLLDKQLSLNKKVSID